MPQKKENCTSLLPKVVHSYLPKIGHCYFPITTGLTYVLVDNQKGAGVRMTDVILLDVYFYERVIHLILQDILSLKTFHIEQQIECTEIDCTWFLIDLNYFIDKMNANAVRKYCVKCHDHDVDSIDNSKSNQNCADDMLEFEF